MSTLAPTLQAYFTDRLARQRQASPHTIAAYRDTFKLLLGFACTHTGKAPSRLDVADLDATLVGAFLDHLEQVRGNRVRTRNARLAAIHSLFRFAALHHPQDAAGIQRVLAIHPNATTRPSSPPSPRPRPTRCWPPPTRPPGPDGATTPCWPWRSQPACGSWS